MCLLTLEKDMLGVTDASHVKSLSEYHMVGGSFTCEKFISLFGGTRSPLLRNVNKTFTHLSTPVKYYAKQSPAACNTLLDVCLALFAVSILFRFP